MPVEKGPRVPWASLSQKCGYTPSQMGASQAVLSPITANLPYNDRLSCLFSIVPGDFLMSTIILPLRLSIMLGTLVYLGPLAIDTYLPALPTIASYFVVAVHQIALSVSF